MKIKSTVVALLISSLFSAQVFAWGALAINGNQGKQYGFSYDYSTSNDAQNRALNECGRGCYIVKTFSSGCAAYAADQAYGSTAYGWGTASNGSEAQSTALNYCRQYGGKQCIVRAWSCNSN